MKFLLVGHGRMGQNHRRVIESTPGAELVGIVEPRGAMVDVPVYTSLDEAKRVGNFDAAIVAAPTHAHHELAMSLLRCGVPVLVEKPIAFTSREACELLGEVIQHRTKLVVGHLERLNPAIRRLAAAIRDGMIGPPVHFAFTRIGGPAAQIEGNNVLLDLAVHDFDVLRMLTESMVRVTHARSTDDHAEVWLQSASKIVTASVRVGWNSPTKIRTLHVTGTEGACFVDYIKQTCEIVRGGVAKTSSFDDVRAAYDRAERHDLDVASREPLRVQLEQTMEFFGGGSRGLLCTGGDALAAVMLAEQAMALSHEGYV